MKEDILKEIKSLLSIGVDNSDVVILDGTNSLTDDELSKVFSIYAPFGDVDITKIRYNSSELTSLTLIGGSQIFGTVLELEITAGSNPLVVYIRKV